MPLGPYMGFNLTPGMGSPSYTAEHDLSGIIYGSPHHCLFVTYAVIDGAARDAGNTDDTTVLRPGLIMAQVTATTKWRPFDSGDSPAGLATPRGILVGLGYNTQMDGADADRYLATIMVKGNVNPEGLCLQASSSYGLAKTGEGLTVREAFALNFMFSDDFMNYTAWPLADR